MYRYIHFTKLKHLIFLNGGSSCVYEEAAADTKKWPTARGRATGKTSEGQREDAAATARKKPPPQGSSQCRRIAPPAVRIAGEIEPWKWRTSLSSRRVRVPR
jgi:hypothetical protein